MQNHITHTSTIVLLGAGHAHLYIASKAKRLRELGARVVLVDPGDFWYSGLATGMVGGSVRASSDRIDAAKLARASGAEFIRDCAVRLDRERRRIVLRQGDELQYDYLSINIGSHVRPISAFDGCDNVWRVKPIANLWRLRQSLEARWTNSESPRIVVVGGGLTGCEIAANVGVLARRFAVAPNVVLVTRSQRILASKSRGAAGSLSDSLRHYGLEIVTGFEATGFDGMLVGAKNRRGISADFVVLATGLTANTIDCDLSIDEGFVVNEYMQSVSDERVFAAGDCAHMKNRHLPKLGVYGVRQAPVIYDNLCAGLQAEDLRPYRPQKRALSILNLGDGTGLALWGSLWYRGRLMQIWKDWLDRRFMEQYRCEGSSRATRGYG